MRFIYYTLTILFICQINGLIGQRYLQDSSLRMIDFHKLDTLGTFDAKDIIEGDYYDTVLDINTVAITDADWTKYWCKRKEHITANREIDLRHHDWNYIRIYYDDFDSYDKAMWQNTSINGTENWNNFIDWGTPCQGDGNQIGLFLNETEECVDGKLKISIKYDPRTIKWNYVTQSYDPNALTTRTFDYVTGRVESTWGFDGSMDVIYQNDGTTTLSEDEGSLCFISKIKHPNEKGLLPAFWLMSNGGIYDEFDVFEYFNENGGNEDNMHSTMHSGHGSPDIRYACGDDHTIDNSSDYHIYTHFWNAFNVATYIDDRDVAIYRRHQFSRANRIGKFPEILEEDEVYNMRKKYNRGPMRINFSSNVYCTMNNTNLNAKYEIDYIAVYKKFPCPDDREYSSMGDLKIQLGVFNVELAKKATFNFPIGSDNPIPDNEMYKLITNDAVDITNMTIGKWSNFIIEHTNDDLCVDQLPAIGELTSPKKINEAKSEILDLMDYVVPINPEVSKNADNIEYKICDNKLLFNNIYGYDLINVYDISGRLICIIEKDLETNIFGFEYRKYSSSYYYFSIIDSKRIHEPISLNIYVSHE